MKKENSIVNKMWRDIENFPNYEISRRGDVRNVKTNRVLAFSYSCKNFTTYKRVTLFKDGVRFYRSVHRLVAEAFIPNPLNLPQVDHIDANGENNYVSNLQWVTASENIQKSFQQNRKTKLIGCSSGGKIGAVTTRAKAETRYKTMLGERFVKFHPSGELLKDACVSYICECGVKRTASTMWKELRNHSGKCPECTNTVNRSSESLL